ncbi:MAG: response regulator [FCB group bacterium]|jgi:two-component system chemotaxis response regulator CheY
MSKTILVAEDSPSIRKFIVFALKILSYNVIPAIDGMDAAEKLQEQMIDLVITDLNMPNMDGFSLIETIRLSGEYKYLPIIILSSLSKEEDIQHGLACGANSYLVKPFNKQKLLYEVSKYIELN